MKSKKSALLLSFTSLLLCFAMLAGSTFAWFTDTATTGVNQIKSGNLDIEVTFAKEKMKEDGTLAGEMTEYKTIEAATDIFDANALWEPGRTEYVAFLVENKGNLALKYQFSLNITAQKAGTNKAGEEYMLANYLCASAKAHDKGFAIDSGNDPNLTFMAKANDLGMAGVENVMNPENKPLTTMAPITGELKAGEKQAIGMAVWMPTDVGNEANPISVDKAATIDLRITVVATQLNYENDSFGPDYDKDAPLPLVATRNELNTTITRDFLKDAEDKIAPVEVTLGNLEAEDIVYDEQDTGYTGKGVMLGNTNLNRYNAEVPEVGAYSFTFKDGVINSAANTYQEPDGRNGPKNSSVYMLVPGNSDVVFENMTFNGVVSFDIQKYTAGWSNLNSLTFKNCTFNGLIVGTCPADHVTFDDCTFTDYTNANNPNSSNPIWWRSESEGQGTNANPIQSFTFINNTVTSTRPIKIERVGNSNANPVFTFKNNTFTISAQDDDTNTKNMAINIGNTGKYTLIDDNNTIKGTTAALYTALLAHGENQYNAISGNKVLDGNGNNKTITAKVWKTTTGETFEMKTID